MKVVQHRRSDIVIFELAGELDASNLPSLQHRMEHRIEGGDVKWVLDLAEIEFIESSAMGFLIQTSKDLGAAGGGIVIARPSPFAQKVLETLGLDCVFPTFSTTEEATQYFLDAEEAGRGPVPPL